MAAENNQTKSNGRGGARKGAGRKAGSITTKTREIADRAMAEGITPLEVMLQSMRRCWDDAESFQAKVAGGDKDAALVVMGARQAACAIAKDAAPYVHPRLAAVEHSGGLKLSHDDWVDGLAEPDDAGTGDGKAKAGD